MIRLLVLLGIFGMADAYAVSGGQLASRAGRKLMVKYGLALSLLGQTNKAVLAAKDQGAMPDHRQRSVDRGSDTDHSRRRSGDTVGGGRSSRSSSNRRDAWEKKSNVFDERNTGERKGSAP